jgi:hypothetical protein
MHSIPPPQPRILSFFAYRDAAFDKYRKEAKCSVRSRFDTEYLFNLNVINESSFCWAMSVCRSKSHAQRLRNSSHTLMQLIKTETPLNMNYFICANIVCDMFV